MSELLISNLPLTIVALVAVAIAPFLVRFINTNAVQKRLATMQLIIESAVVAAEMMLGDAPGEEKLDWVTQQVEDNLAEIGWTVPEDQLRRMIEWSVYVVKKLQPARKELAAVGTTGEKSPVNLKLD